MGFIIIYRSISLVTSEPALLPRKYLIISINKKNMRHINSRVGMLCFYRDDDNFLTAVVHVHGELDDSEMNVIILDVAATESCPNYKVRETEKC